LLSTVVQPAEPEGESALALRAAPAEFSVGSTFGWTALALTPFAIMVFAYRQLSGGWLLWAVITTAANLIAVLLLGYAVQRRGISFRDYIALPRPDTRVIVIGIVSQLALYIVEFAYVMFAAPRCMFISSRPRRSPKSRLGSRYSRW
jgi:hypothetical protein